MDNKQSPNNVIQFPGRKKENESTVAPAPAPAQAKAVKSPKAKASKKTAASTVLAIILATAAVNQFAFKSASESTSLASVSTEGSVRRGLASVQQHRAGRDAKWEKDLAERLASPKLRTIASVQIGRPATMEEKLRWGTLEEKYTITYKMEHPQIQSILLQDAGAAPAYVLDRMKFLKDYGPLFETNYQSAKLKSVETSDDKTIESYLILDGDNQPRGEARFELDRHKRLLSLKVEPVQI